MSEMQSNVNTKKKLKGLIVIAILILCYLAIIVGTYLRDNAKKNLDNLIPVQKGDYWGYVNEDNETKIDYLFKAANVFNSGHAIVTAQDRIGIINREGDYIIKPMYIEIIDIENDFVVCKDSNNLYQIICTTDTTESFGPYKSVTIIDNISCIVVDSSTNLYGLFVDGSLKYECKYNNITSLGNEAFELQKGLVTTRYSID